MKHLLLTLLIIISLITGCANLPPSERNVFKHELELVVKADEAITMTETPKYKLPESPYLKLSNLTALSHNGQAFAQIYSGLSVSDYTRFVNDLLYLENETEIRIVHILINSPGGDAFAGMALADAIIQFQKKGFIIIGHGSGIIASATVPVFAACNPRYAASGTMFMVHEAALWKWPGHETASDIRSQHELMVELQDRYIQYLPKTSISAERWIELIKMTTWFNVQKAIEWGLVTKVE